MGVLKNRKKGEMKTTLCTNRHVPSANRDGNYGDGLISVRYSSDFKL
jgi:hypothetical protein